jgi:hypothetical protein
MGRIEKTIFLSYRRTDEWVGVAIFQDLTQHGYDVFIDYDGIASGKFETVILENIKARAHFLVLLTPTALERCDDPEDWMRREIEAALDSKRNIVPLMFEGFDFDTPATASQLTGKLAALKEYNGLEVPKARFFASEMERLRNKYLNVPVDAVLHTASDAARQIAKEQKDKALNVRVDAVLHPTSDSAQQAKEQKDKATREIEAARKVSRTRGDAIIRGDANVSGEGVLIVGSELVNSMNRNPETEAERRQSEAKRRAEEEERRKREAEAERHRAEEQRQRDEAEAKRRAEEDERRRLQPRKPRWQSFLASITIYLIISTGLFITVFLLAAFVIWITKG